MQNQGAIIAENLVKVYNGKVRAVEGVSFNVAPGEIFGFLGPNGAGKTTTVSMLSAGLRPTEGRAIIDGLEVSHNAEAVKRRIGVIFQEATADGDLTGRENLEVAAGTYGISRAEGRSRATALIEEMHLTDAADRYSKTYSGGMRRRLELAVGLVHRPKILFLDEPTLGLDPQGRAGFWGYVQKLRKETGMTVFVTTHYLDEADTMCDRIAIIDHGRIVAEGTPEELKREVAGDVVMVGPEGPTEKARDILKGQDFIRELTEEDGDLRLYVDAGETALPQIIRLLDCAGVTLTTLSLHRPSLDDVFFRKTGRSLRETAP